MLSLIVVLLASEPTITTSEPAPNWAIELHLTNPVAARVGLGSIGLGAYQVPIGAEVSVERGVGSHTSAFLGATFSASYTQPAAYNLVTVGLAPGVRWYLNKLFEGPWLHIELPLGFAVGQSALAGGSVPFSTNTLLGSLGLVFGWNISWANRMLLSLGAGPMVNLGHTWGGGGGVYVLPPTTSGAVGLRALIGLGVTL